MTAPTPGPWSLSGNGVRVDILGPNGVVVARDLARADAELVHALYLEDQRSIDDLSLSLVKARTALAAAVRRRCGPCEDEQACACGEFAGSSVYSAGCPIHNPAHGLTVKTADPRCGLCRLDIGDSHQPADPRCSHRAPARSDDGRTAVELTKGPDGVPGSVEPWASGLRGAVLTGLMRSPWAAEAGPIRAAVMRDLYAEVERILAARLRHDDGEADRG